MPRLFIPGPVAVSSKTLAAMQRPMIGHRTNEFVRLYRSLTPGLQELFGTIHPVYISTSSAWGVMEGALRSLVRRKVLCCQNGAFSDKWLEVAHRCGLQADGLKFDWGCPVDPDKLKEVLSNGDYDAVTLIHNETSCGCMSDLSAIAGVLREFPNVISIVDVVSSFSSLELAQDIRGLDVLLAGSQKALALPPGLTMFTASPRALARAAEVQNRGYYFDLLEFQRNHEAGMTPSTPSISLIYALASKLEDIATEGLWARCKRHMRLNEKVRTWGESNGLPLFPSSGYGSITLNCLNNKRGLDVPAFLAALRLRGFVIDGGYGPLKGKTLRISNMGDETDESIAELIEAMDESLKETG